MKHRLILVFYFFFHLSGLLAQETDKDAFARLKVGSIPISQEGEISECIRIRFESVLPGFNNDRIHLRLADQRRSLTGWHFLYRQYLDSFPVFGAELKVNTRGKEAILSSIDQTLNLNGYNVTPPNRSAGMRAFRSMSSAYCTSENRCEGMEYVLYPNKEEKSVEPALHFFVRSANDYRELLINAEGEVLLNRSLLRFFGPDTLVRVRIFQPDPLTSAGVMYGGQFQDFNDQDNPWINQQLRDTIVPALFRNGLFRLEQPYLISKDVEGDPLPPPAKSSDNFRYTRGQAPFEMVHSYAHITRFNAYIRSLGYTGATDFQLEVDGRGTADDNSFFSPENPPRVVFGTGGVDDAEDGEVVIHEYGHALSHWASPGSNIGKERKALDEGVCDYFAVSYSRQFSDYRWWDVFKWDGHNAFWPGRIANSSKHYPEDFDTSDIYASGEIWSSVLMELFEEMGRENCDRLVMEWLFSFAPNLSYQNAAGLLLITAESLYGRQWQDFIFERLLARGLLEGFESGIHGNFEMQNLHGGLIAYLNAVDPNARLEVYDMNGRLLYYEDQIRHSIISVPARLFPVSGMYIIRITLHPGKEDEKILINKFIRF